jgi:hypothetical protein
LARRVESTPTYGPACGGASGAWQPVKPPANCLAFALVAQVNRALNRPVRDLVSIDVDDVAVPLDTSSEMPPDDDDRVDGDGESECGVEVPQPEAESWGKPDPPRVFGSCGSTVRQPSEAASSGKRPRQAEMYDSAASQPKPASTRNHLPVPGLAPSVSPTTGGLSLERDSRA